MKKSKIKTNALRMLDRDKIPYEIKTYEYDEEHLSGEHVASQVDMDAGDIYKTLVLHEDHDYLVCCIPVLEEIDLKKLAKLSGHKKVEMLHMKDLLGLTGYIRGGCSPVGMKKKFPTYIEETAVLFDKIAVSAGMRGVQILIDPEQLAAYTEAAFAPLVRE